MKASIKYTELSLIKDINLMYKNKIIIYGTGKSGIKFYREMKLLGIQAYCFCETSPQKNQTEGLKIISQKELFSLLKTEDFLIVVASVYFNEIYDDLINKGIRCLGVVSDFSAYYSICLNIDSPNIPNNYRIKHKKIMKVWKKVYLQYVESLKAINDFTILSSSLMHPKILILQPGKVGSMSIHTTFKKYGRESYHCHMLNNRGLSVYTGIQELLNMLKEFPIKIITGVRDPIERAFSSFTHCLEQYYGWLVKDELTNDLCESFINYLKKYVCNDNLYSETAPKFNGNEYCALGNQAGNEFAWFDKEIRELFGVDIYQCDFNRESGYSIIKQNNVEIFLYKLEKLQELEKELGDFAGISNFKLEMENSVSNKITRNLNRELKKKVHIPAECLDYYYKNNNRFLHFYSKREAAEFRKKWEINL